MFKAPFSFKGRIGRTEFALSFLLMLFNQVFIKLLAGLGNTHISSLSDLKVPFSLLYISILMLHLAQGAKRCHDLGKSGWCQIIPFYSFLMLFEKGDKEANRYGYRSK